MKLSAAEIDSLLFAEQASDPATPASGYGRIYTKADGAYFIDDTGAVTGPFAESTAGSSSNATIIRRTTNQSIPNNTFWTTVTFDTETLDDGGWWSSGDATKLYPAAGTVKVAASVPFATHATGVRWVAIRHYNSAGTTLQTLSKTVPGLAGVGVNADVGDLFVVTAGDYFSLLVYQNSGGALNIEGTSTIPIQLTAFNL